MKKVNVKQSKRKTYVYVIEHIELAVVVEVLSNFKKVFDKYKNWIQSDGKELNNYHNFKRWFDKSEKPFYIRYNEGDNVIYSVSKFEVL